MIPLKLTIEGLYSYRTRQTIDFTSLTPSGLFGIFGGVGSGKSSILEAISFALYGESQRLGKKDDRNYNMMNLKSDRLYIDFEFRSGKDSLYRFVTEGKRNSRRFDDVKTFDRKAYHYENDEWIPIDPESIETITGLNYENFHRTIIIPQGKFAEFLRLSPSERTTMLMELFSLSKYNLYDKVTALENRNKTEITRISSTMEGIGEVSPDHIETLQTRMTELQRQIRDLNKDTAEKERTEKDMENVRKLIADITVKKASLEKLKKSETEIRQLELEIREYEQINRIFKTDVTTLHEAQHNFDDNKRQLDTVNLSLKKDQHELDRIVTVYNDLKQSHDQKEGLKQESDEFSKLAQVRDLEKETTQLSIKAGSLEKEIQETENQIKDAQEKQSAKSRELEILKASCPDFKMLSGIKNWFKDRKRILEDLLNYKGKTTVNEKAIRDNKEKARQAVILSGFFAPIPLEAELIDLGVIVGNCITDLEMLQADLVAQRSGFELRKGLEKYATELHEGEPCPLCGSEIHPRVLDSTDVHERLNKLIAQSELLLGQLKTCRQLEKDITGFESTEKALLQQDKNDQKELLSLLKKLKDHEAGFTWSGYDQEDESKVLEAERRYEQIQVNIGKIEKEIKEFGTLVEKKRGSLNVKKEEAHQVSQQITVAVSSRRILVDQIVLIDINSLAEFPKEQLLQRAANLSQQYDDLIQRFKEAEEKYKKLQESVNTLAGQVSALERTRGGLLERLTVIREKIEAKLAAHGGLSLTYVQDLLQKDIDIETGRSRIEEYRKETGSLVSYLKEKETELAGRVYDEEAHLQLKTAIQAQRGSAETLNRQMGELQQEITTLTGNAARYEALKAELEDVRMRGKDISVLKGLFWGNGFVNYVSTIYLSDLCRAANERFYRLTRKQLGLELAQDNTFLVRDYMNEGRVRSAKSLSGGQTFQASLSLALALADSIHRLAGSQENFFFLDEGFGSLDKETLEVAFDTLKSLRKENRIVGVISHVEEMQTEIGTYLRVTNDEENGSIVRASMEIV